MEKFMNFDLDVVPAIIVLSDFVDAGSVIFGVPCMTDNKKLKMNQYVAILQPFSHSIIITAVLSMLSLLSLQCC